MPPSPDAYRADPNSSLSKPVQPTPPDQPPWNTQRGSQMPYGRYRPHHETVEPVSLPG
jgi:2-isopropylmalate synthase